MGKDSCPVFQPLQVKVDQIAAVAQDRTPGWQTKVAGIDEIIQQLLDRLEELHEQDCIGGLLHPQNILFSDAQDPLEVTLPDAGFYWVAGPIPRWLSAAEGHRGLWDQTPENMNLTVQQTQTQTEGITPAQIQQDLRTVARLCLRLLAGVLPSDKHKIPENFGLPTERKRRFKDEPREAGCWNVLREVLKTDDELPSITTVGQFKQQLEQYPLREHFGEHFDPPTNGPEPGPKIPPSLVTVVCSVLTLVCLGVAIWSYRAMMTRDFRELLDRCDNASSAGEKISALQELHQFPKASRIGCCPRLPGKRRCKSDVRNAGDSGTISSTSCSRANSSSTNPIARH